MTHWFHMINTKDGQNIITVHLTQGIYGSPFNIPPCTTFNSKKCGSYAYFHMVMG